VSQFSLISQSSVLMYYLLRAEFSLMEFEFRCIPSRNYVLGINWKSLETFGQLVPFLFALTVQVNFCDINENDRAKMKYRISLLSFNDIKCNVIGKHYTGNIILYRKQLKKRLKKCVKYFYPNMRVSARIFWSSMETKFWKFSSESISIKIMF